MRLKVLGAAEEVTGSSYMLEVAGHRILIDCGLHQGRNEDERNREPFHFDPLSLEVVLLTHAHIDHTGRVPLLVKQGFSGKVMSTLPTVELTEVLWRDSARLMKEEAEWKTKKNARKGLPAVEPLFEDEDVSEALNLLAPVTYDDKIELFPEVFVRFRDAGHIMGSAILEIWATERDETVKIVFSGDLGPQKTVMERTPAVITGADYVVIESTYGDREHKTNEESREEFQTLMRQILAKKAKVFIPTFVVDRAQRVAYELMLIQDQGLGKDIPIYFDSPMGVKATKIYEDHLDLCSSEIQEYRHKGNHPFSPERLTYVSSVEDSQAINDVDHAIVLAGSGMCNGGRIVHHLKHGIWNPENHVVFVGYQAVGTLGRRLVEGQKKLRIAGEDVTVRAQLHTINGFSAHADRRDLLKWADNFSENSPTFLVTHGEPKSANALADGLTEKGFQAIVPSVDQEFELTPNEREREERIVLSTPQRDVSSYVELAKALDDIAAITGRLTETASKINDIDQTLPMLKSVKILLETVSNKSKC
ncbi:MBL fold metallo-hydrolase [Dethiosulfovibrio sp. F2B]|uniref:MBL fold metallo-hydrolase RNA specificity domain-containing protein n=1 Tax=Dethiosulfovibrio faecalis TaxID=2720018 RepID=UPI001F313483|nr:MBL fold metallo-hydrolase [Dethiosulfovibrio faecalis]MCF4151984.1 MBL fold metallo-hydrolase [Dethiosulfovibrio faecalis]